MEKEYDIPEEIKDIYIKYSSLAELRDEYTKLRGGFKKAVKCAKLAEKKRDEFWREVKKLYPVFSYENEGIDYNPTIGKIRVSEKVKQPSAITDKTINTCDTCKYCKLVPNGLDGVTRTCRELKDWITILNVSGTQEEWKKMEISIKYGFGCRFYKDRVKT